MATTVRIRLPIKREVTTEDFKPVIQHLVATEQARPLTRQDVKRAVKVMQALSDRAERRGHSAFSYLIV